ILLFDDEVLLHISRPMRWDSDHVVLFNDKVKMMGEELVRSGKLEDVHIGLDFFDASINRIGAWVTGIRSMRKALLWALLQPMDLLMEYEESGNGWAAMALAEEQAILPFGDVWDEYCRRTASALEGELIDIIGTYEEQVLKERT
ncbi:MAG: L-rhamnose isomerase, partial [Sphaerochaeta sp.]|nr:L-rhamnose isomerase [Sphaerochaeta sp.]